MKRITKKEIKEFVKFFVKTVDTTNLHCAGFYIDEFGKLDVYVNYCGSAHNLEYKNSDYVFDFTSYILDYFSTQDLKYNLNDLYDEFYVEVNLIIKEFNDNDKSL